MLVLWEQLAIDHRPGCSLKSYSQYAGNLLGFKWDEEKPIKISGSNNHAYGKPSHLRIPIYCFDAQTHHLVHEFSGVRAACKSLGMCNNTIKKYVDNGFFVFCWQT